MEVFEEPLTQRQRDELQRLIAHSTQFLRVVVFLGFVSLIGVVFRSLQGLISTEFPIWIAPTLVISVWVYLRAAAWTGGRRLRADIRKDLAHGKVDISVLSPKSVEEVEEFEDEGPSYILQTKDDFYYLLTGQEMARYKSEEFPWETFGVVETRHAKRFFGLRRMGGPMPVSRQRAPFKHSLAKELGCFESSFIVLDDAKRKLLSGT